LEEKLKKAKLGDIAIFNELFQQHNSSLKSYLYRLLTNREDVEDFYHNTFIRAFEKIDTFNGDVSQLKSWIFTIATRLSINHLNQKKRWKTNAQDECRDSLVNNPEEQKNFVVKVVKSTHNYYDVKEHIDFCFTCINKTLTIEKQIALLLKNVYEFKVKEVAEIMNKSLGQVKHLLVDARKEMTEIFEGRCALINQKGTCHQCSELQGLFNPKVDFHREAMKLEMVKDAENRDKDSLFDLREELVKNINPLESRGTDLHDYFMQHLKKVNELN
jgi:RNA polymerase sigma-70 factor (ECF subfamily)